MPVIGAAAAADDPDLRHSLHQLPVPLPEIDRIAGIQRFAVVQFGMAHARGICPQPMNAFCPSRAMIQRLGKIASDARN